VATLPPLPLLRHLELPELPHLPRPELPDLASLSGLTGRACPEWHDAGAAVRAGVDEARARLARSVRRIVVGDAPPPRDLYQDAAGDPGLFGPDSVTWRVHADPAMFIGGLRALLLQTMHPLAMAGVADHSDFRHDPVGRLWRTSAFVGTTTYGTTEQALAAVEVVRRVHRHVRGTAPDGRTYAANDPHLITWVHHAEVDSFLTAYRRYGAEPLSDADADRYVDEMAVMCELFDAEPAARSVAELEAYFHAVRSELIATPAARDAVRWLMVPPLPWPARLAYAVIAPAAVGSLPGWVQRALWLPMAPGVDPLVVRPAALALTRSLGWVMAGYRAESDGRDDGPHLRSVEGPSAA
jgi:uncharacterized protein (DUF2236 family)